jgi:NitT/TauT family transport system substrate-binding protein
MISCSKPEQLTIMVPAGAPALSQIYLQNDDDYLVDIVNGPDPLVAAFGSESHDFIFAPTNLGAKLYNNEIEYVFLAAVTFGNYFLATVSETSFNLASLEEKEIVCFGMNSTSDIILKYILDSNNINASITYVDSLEMANSSLIADNDKIILSAEPALSVLKTKISGIKTIDLQAEYQTITGDNSYPQSGVFARKDLSDRVIDKFLDDLESSIGKVNLEVEQTADLAVDLEMGFTKEVLIAAIPNSHIDYRDANDIKMDLENYFNIIYDINPVLIGGKLPDDNFYYSSR